MRAEAKHLGGNFIVDDYPIRNAGKLPSVLAAILLARPDALVVDDDPSLISKSGDIIALAGGLPTISGNRQFADAGGLMTYGVSIFEVYRRSASYIDRVLSGERPADMPIEQPIKFELVINLKTPRCWDSLYRNCCL